jgi:cob(I)alamin adenosyltransferase
MRFSGHWNSISLKISRVHAINISLRHQKEECFVASKRGHSSKIYTGGGDRGRTSLFSGERVKKSHWRVETYGDLDELNSALGTVAAFCPPEASDITAEIQQIQSLLFQMGAWLASTPEAPITQSLKPFTQKSVDMLEAAIDRMEATLSPLSNFILPGGHPAAAVSHVGRSVCRRVERKMVHFLHELESDSTENVYAVIAVFLNRLSDYLFVLARYLNQRQGVADVTW